MSNWMRIESAGRGNFNIKILWWHPGFWREAYNTVRASGGGRLESVWLTAVLVSRVMKSP